MPIRTGGRYYADLETGRRRRAPAGEQIEPPAPAEVATERVETGPDEAPAAQTRRGRKAPKQED